MTIKDEKPQDLETKDNNTYIILFILNCAVLLVILILISSVMKEDYEISKDGKETIGIVENFNFSQRRTRRGTRSYYYHKILYDGYSKEIDLGKRYDEGTKFYVTYLPQKPEVIKIGKAKGTFYDLIRNDVGVKGLFVCCWFIITTYITCRWVRASKSNGWKKKQALSSTR